MDRSYRNEEWLREKYLEEKMLQREIANLCDVSQQTISDWLKKFGIETRGKEDAYRPNARYKNEKWLRQKYLKEGLNGREIANICDCGSTTIHSWINDFNIEKEIFRAGNHIPLEDDLKSFIFGLLLGDGSMVTDGGPSARYQHVDTNYGFVYWLQSRFSKTNIVTKIYEVDKSYENEKWNNSTQLLLNTLAYREFKEIRDYFYPNGKKIIPKNLRINPTIILLWYLGDGSFGKSKSSRACRISSYSFRRNQLENIVEQLNKIQIKSSVNSNGIHVWKESQDDFFEYMLESPYRPPCYSYKFPESYRDEFPD